MENENQNIIEVSKIFSSIKDNFFSISIIIFVSVILGTGSSYLFEKRYTSIAKLMPVESYEKSNSLGSALSLNSVLGGEQNSKLTSNFDFSLLNLFSNCSKPSPTGLSLGSNSQERT